MSGDDGGMNVERRTDVQTQRQLTSAPAMASTDMRTAVEDNALRDAIYRSSRSGWTKNTDRSRLQLQQPAHAAVRHV